jgi:hypothetical protein
MYLFPQYNHYSGYPFFVDFPILQIDSMFAGVKSFSLLNTKSIAVAPLRVISFDVITNSKAGAAPEG